MKNEYIIRADSSNLFNRQPIYPFSTPIRFTFIFEKITRGNPTIFSQPPTKVLSTMNPGQLQKEEAVRNRCGEFKIIQNEQLVQ
jgi:hypothetical protein